MWLISVLDWADKKTVEKKGFWDIVKGWFR